MVAFEKSANESEKAFGLIPSDMSQVVCQSFFLFLYLTIHFQEGMTLFLIVPRLFLIFSKPHTPIVEIKMNQGVSKEKGNYFLTFYFRKNCQE